MATTVPQLRTALKGKAPSLRFEQDLWDAGKGVVVGMDEVGRGAWAGPVSVGAAVIPRDRRIYKIRDSKMLTEEEREALFNRLAGWCRAWAVGHASHQECDQMGMSTALTLAATRALDGLGIAYDHVLLDGNWDFVLGGEADLLVKGDARSLSIATASILAKVTRDRILRAAAAHYPQYGFESNKGYPGPVHRTALYGYGPCTIHRRSWAFMDGLPWTGIKRYERPESQQRLFD